MLSVDTLAGSDALEVIASGRVTADDYESVLTPELDKPWKAPTKLKLLYRIAEDCEGFSAGAMWDDAKFGMKHINDFAAVAVVTDKDWMVHTVKALRFLLPSDIQVFSNAQIVDARAWVKDAL